MTQNLNQANTGDSTTVTAFSTPLNTFNVTPNLNQAACLQTPKALIGTPLPLNIAILTPPPTIGITNACSTKAKNAADSVCK